MNIEAVARRANVSTATVSRVINRPELVRASTAAAVLEIIRELNFYPNRNARALGTGRSSMFGLIISDITNPFFPELVKAFETIAVEHGQEVLVANTDYDPVRMEHCLSRMLERKVDGVAIMTSEIDEALIGPFGRRGIPLVFLDGGTPALGVNTISVDYKAGVGLAMRHLRSLGHRRIGFISGPLRLISAQRRLDAFAMGMAVHQPRMKEKWIEEGDHRIEGGKIAMRRMLTSKVLPTAVIASNDLTAIGAIDEIHEKGLRVPEDISVIGFDDIHMSAFTYPALTTISLPRAQIAQIAFQALFESYDGQQIEPRTGKNRVIEPTLVIRKSTGPPKK
ncbi:LacI family DNA-binding transcriptional regulator [Granulicella sp. S190]|uniref:LacI family DNA-binding transcriptional regulator n=1 Tax=Granulicella sp. S190 TaxID=1747226 RepID=UPI00131AD16C|nr:LacI family DNA-binding transcriptional regulator [Granulicella sp. S190]